MDKLKNHLSKRLEMTASFIKTGEIIADIGTDHAYLPTYLVTNGICPRAIASDVKIKPLNNAKKIVELTHSEDKIKLILSDGLDKFCAEDADVFIFAGMGGTLISRILENTLWIKTDKIRFVFQPMSHHKDIVEFLINNDFELCEEKSCFDSGRCYVAFSAIYSGRSNTYSKSFPYIGLLSEEKTESSRFFIKKQLEHLEKKITALKKNGISNSQTEELNEIICDLQKYI